MFETKELIEYGGLLTVFLVVYGQTGVFFCFFVPSGAFIFSGGAMAASGLLNWHFGSALLLLTLAAILGNITGYIFGRKAGYLLFKRPDSRFFKQENLQAANKFYKKRGKQALAIGMFIPVVRTFSPILAGIIKVKFSRFLFYVSIGSAAWIGCVFTAGYAIGSRPLLRPYLNYIIIGIIIVVTIPVVRQVVKGIKKARK